MATSAGHDLDDRDPEARRPYSAPRDPSTYHARMSALMASEGVQVWQALMRENRERAERKRGAA